MEKKSTDGLKQYIRSIPIATYKTMHNHKAIMF